MIQNCNKCKTSFQWGQVLKANWLRKNLRCENCGTEHKITQGSRLLFVYFSVIPLLIFGLFLTPFENVAYTIMASIAIAIVFSFWTPFFVKYKK